MVVEFYYPSVVDVGGTPRGIMPILAADTPPTAEEAEEAFRLGWDVF